MIVTITQAACVINCRSTRVLPLRAPVPRLRRRVRGAEDQARSLEERRYGLTPLSLQADEVKRLIIEFERPTGRTPQLLRYSNVQETLAPEVYELPSDVTSGCGIIAGDERWSGYAHLKNLTGGSRELEQLRRNLGDAHIVGNFQYSGLGCLRPGWASGAGSLRRLITLSTPTMAASFATS